MQTGRVRAPGGACTITPQPCTFVFLSLVQFKGPVCELLATSSVREAYCKHCKLIIFDSMCIQKPVKIKFHFLLMDLSDMVKCSCEDVTLVIFCICELNSLTAKYSNRANHDRPFIFLPMGPLTFHLA